MVNNSPPALRLSAAIRAGGHGTTLKKTISGATASGFNLSQQHPFPLSRKFFLVSFRFSTPFNADAKK